MKAVITEVKFNKEFDSKFGKLYSFYVAYDGKRSVYSSKSKDQKTFIAGQEAEFTEETKTYQDKEGNTKEYTVIKPPAKFNQSGFTKALSKEQSRYSGFAVSYVKDLVVAGRVQLSDLETESWKLFNLMVEMDKTLKL